MFDALKKGFKEAQNRLAGLAELNEKNIQAALQEVRRSLLEADVELGVVKRFLARVEEKALGSTVAVRVKHKGQSQSVSAGDQFIKICHDELVAMMDFEGERIRFAPSGRTQIMLVGLQGSGKTTSAAKLARLLTSEGKKPLLVAADMQRPAAVEQLKVLGEQIEVPVFNLPGETPLAICAAAPEEAKRLGRDVIIYDTAGRLAIDEELMQELSAIKQAVSPENTFLVIDAMIGQDAVKTAGSFNEQLKLSGVILTKLDGDARGGAALSVKEVTGAPVLFAGMGETTDKLEEFRPEGMAGRILGMGDVVGLMKDFEEVIDAKQAEEDAARMMSGEFTLEDFLNQIRTIRQMGSLKDLVEKMPGLGGMVPPGVNLDDAELVRIEAIIQSMTRTEKGDPNLLIREPTRVGRVARGSGQPEQGVTELIQKFLFMRQMMAGMGGSGLLGKIPGMKNLAMARNMRRAMKGGGGMPGGFPGMPGMGLPGMPGMGLPGMPGMPGMGMPGLGGAETTVRKLSKSEKNARKGARKRERTARKKGRK
ncbi:MAG: signal recognition particle protein [Polyangiaceae bacterium]|nr:signal recognition particle protein [Polyangiaceae bacterium]MCW5792326.1 signal recognition particle protein [Polyangiaceae bacterium]